MLSRNLEQTLHRALSLASERRHEYATLEHLLLGLADDSDAATVLRRIVRHRGSPLGVPGNMLFRRSAFEAAGGFPEWAYALDVGLAARLVTQGAFYGMPRSLSQFRLAGGSSTSTARKANVAEQHAFLRSLRREHPDVVRPRDVALGLARQPLVWLRERLMMVAADDPTSVRHRVAARVLKL